MGELISKILFKVGLEKVSSFTPKSFFDIVARDADGDLVYFSQFKKCKVIMIVNIASK